MRYKAYDVTVDGHTFHDIVYATTDPEDRSRMMIVAYDPKDARMLHTHSFKPNAAAEAMYQHVPHRPEHPPKEHGKPPIHVRALNTQADRDAALIGWNIDRELALTDPARIRGRDVKIIHVIDGGRGYGYVIVDRKIEGGQSKIRQAYYGKTEIIKKALA